MSACALLDFGQGLKAIDRKHFTITMSNCALLIVIFVCQLNFAFNSLDDKTAMVESVNFKLHWHFGHR
jgi:hypothetical protein